MVFVSSVRYDLIQTSIDFYLLMCQIKLRCMFSDSDYVAQSKCKLKSTFVPVINKPQLITFEKLVMKDIIKLENQMNGYGKNLSKIEITK